MRSKAFTRFFLPAALGALFAQSAGADGLALVNCNVFDGVENGIRENATVLVSGDRIERIADRDEDRPDGYEVIDCAGHYLAPGLIDVHTHLDNPEAMRRALDSGTTTVRSASVPAFQDVGLRELVRAGALAGPDVVAAGVYVTPDLEDGIMADPRLAPLHGGVRTEAELRLVVRVNAERGVDVIKLLTSKKSRRGEEDSKAQVGRLVVGVEEPPACHGPGRPRREGPAQDDQRLDRSRQVRRMFLRCDSYSCSVSRYGLQFLRAIT